MRGVEPKRRSGWRVLLVTGGLLVGVAWSGPGVWAQSHIGAKRCKTCHEFEYMRWAAGPHARAHESLSAAQRKDPKCNTCHTMLPEETEARFEGVQCERCHGPGSYYHRQYVMRDKELSRVVGLLDPKAENCRRCHTEGTPSISPFSFDEMWERIDHGPRAKRRWKSVHERSSAKAH